ncbi:MAG TPA: serine hydrolase domain-containing protein [Candidatus Acidoferrum sp.]|nr:serine hydrolase domain-containing protein [Candidatus Acidoferrum sp.]
MSGKFRSLAAVLFLIAPARLASQTLPLDKAQRIDRVVSQYEKLGYFNGAILVADRGKVIYSKGVGQASFDYDIPNTPQTKFGIASITKQFTALLILQQVAENKIALHGKVTDYLAWYRKDTGNRMTIEQLVHHTSGMPSDFDWPEFNATPEGARRYEHQEFAEKFCQPALTSEPGTKWEYSNCGYNLLGLILERVSGIPFEVLLQQRILDPLGMKNSEVGQNNWPPSGSATGYLRHAGPRYSRGALIDLIHGFSSGSMYSTVEDLYKWNQALTGGDFISKELREQIFTPGLHDWGYGWFIAKIPVGQPGAGNTMAEMRGDMPENFFAWILRYPERDAVIITLRNVYGSTEGLEQNIQAILFDGAPHLPSRSPKDIAAQIWLVPAAWIASHITLSVLLMLIVVATIWMAVRRKRQTGASTSP